MEWIIKMLINEYGKKAWNKLSEQDKIFIIAEFGFNLKHSFDYLKKFTTNK